MDPFELILRNQIRLRQIAAGLSGLAARQLTALADDLVALIARFDPVSPVTESTRLRRLDLIIIEASPIIANHLRDVQRDTRAALAVLGREQAEWAQRFLRDVGGIPITGPPPVTQNSTKALLSRSLIVGRPLDEWFEAEETRLAFLLRQNLRQTLRTAGAITGSDPAQAGVRVIRRPPRLLPALIEEVRGPIIERATNGAAGIMQTAVTHISVESHWLTFKETSASSEYIWYSVLDRKTSDICIALDLQTFRYDNPKAPRPPAHPWCRSGIAPVIKGMERFKKVGWDQWFFEQSRAKQDDILGPGKADLVRRGKITLRELIRSDLSIRPLSELSQN